MKGGYLGGVEQKEPYVGQNTTTWLIIVKIRERIYCDGVEGVAIM